MKRIFGRIKKKLRDRGGETLAEVMLALLILTLSSLLFMVMMNTAFHLDTSAKERSKVFYESLSGAEQKNGATSMQGRAVFKITVPGGVSDVLVDVDLDVYPDSGIGTYKQ